MRSTDITTNNKKNIFIFTGKENIMNQTKEKNKTLILACTAAPAYSAGARPRGLCAGSI